MRFVLAPLAAAAYLSLVATAQASVEIHIDLTSQTMHVASAGGDYDWPVSTGRPGHRTPTGVYRPRRMYISTYSRKYDNAPMPHAIFFTGGYAIHGTWSTGLLGQVASHGCIRLAPENAATLFDLVRHEGARIEISGHAPGSDAVAQHERHRSHYRMATARRQRRHEVALGYAPRERRHSLRDWSHDPLGSQ